MARSAAAVEKRTPSKPAHYAWSFSGLVGSVTVHLNLDVVERLQKGLDHIQHGLLFGNAAGPITEVSDFKGVSAAELAVARAGSSLPTGPEGLAAVGYFRVDRSGVLQLNDDDTALAGALFPNPHEVFLLIQTSDSGPAKASFFFWDGDRMGTFPFLEFPFDASMLATPETIPQRRVEAPAGKPKAVDVVREVSRQILPTSGRRSKRAFWVTAAVLLVAIPVATFVALKLPPSQRSTAAAPVGPAPVAPVSLGLQVVRQDSGDLKLSWDHDTTVIAKANSGMLLIQDGATPRLIPLDASLVHGGSLLYSPKTDQVQMQLTVEGPEQATATEMVLVVIPKAGAPQVQPLSAKKAAPSLRAEMRPPDPAPPAATVETRPVRPFVAPQPAKNSAGAAAPAPLSAPPTLNPASGNVTLSTSVLTTSVSPPPLPMAPPARNSDSKALAFDPPPALAPASQVPPEAPSSAPPAAPSAASAARLTKVHHAAEAIVQQIPIVPAIFRGSRYKPEVIKVTVSIDQTGKVVKVVPSGEGQIPWLVLAAENAAKAWRFKPARIGDQPVPSEMVLSFKFEPRP